MQVSIIIKALNEERRIAACIEAALKASSALHAEVILVDSISVDRTVEIASSYPIRIVRFDRQEDRGCGAAVELGWRHARGEFVYVLDADMLLDPGFLAAALAYLAANPGVAGVAGKLMDLRFNTAADFQRARASAAMSQPIVVPELGGGGLYRRKAIEDVGYLAHWSLQAYEEAELGCRLRARGWTLVRLPAVGVSHEGHSETNFQMLVRLWKNGRAKSAAVLLRSAFGKPWATLAARKFAHLLVTIAIHLVTIVVAGYLFYLGKALAAILAWLGIWLGVVCLLAIVNKSFTLAAWRFVFWNYSCLALIYGLQKEVKDPLRHIDASELKSTGIYGARLDL